jgi:hypothetical protein
MTPLLTSLVNIIFFILGVIIYIVTIWAFYKTLVDYPREATR